MDANAGTILQAMAAIELAGVASQRIPAAL